MSEKESLTGGIRGKSRVRLLQYHRLYVFNRVFDKYLLGLETSDAVKIAARKMLEAGLPEKL